MPLSRHVKIFPHPELPGMLVLFSLKRLSLIYLPESLIPQIADGSLSDDNRDLLTRLGFLVEDPAREREEMAQFVDRVNAGRKIGAMVLLLNLDCNLACPYCYEGSGKGRRYMSEETADAAIDYALRRILPEREKLRIDFHGGEPLLSLGLLRRIARALREGTERAGKGFGFNVVTNGTLLDGATTEELVSLGMEGVRVTIDGPRELHDRSRPFVSGKGSFDLILKNLKEATRFLKVQLGGNYTRETYREFPRLIDDLLREGITPENIESVVFGPVTGTFSEIAVTDAGGCCGSDEPWIAEAVPFLREEILKRGFRAPGQGHTVCAVEMIGDIIVSHDGSLYKCPALVGRAEYRVGDLSTGPTDAAEHYRPGIWKNDECLDCSYLPFCFGGCRFIVAVRDGAVTGVDCRKPFFDATLEELIMQDIRHRRR